MRKTITLEESTWKKLTKAKLDLDCFTIGDVIERLFKLITKFKLGNELKELG